MISTRTQVATRQLAADHYGATPQGVSRGHKSSLQTAETKSMQSQAEKRRRYGGPEKLALLEAARGASAGNRGAINSISGSHTPAGRQGNAPSQHQWQRTGRDATDMIRPSHTGACRSVKLDTSTTLTETRSRRSQVATRAVGSMPTGTTARQAVSCRNALDSMTSSHTGTFRR